MLSLFITKLLAAIIALFMPFAATAPALTAAVAPEVNYNHKDAVATWDVSKTNKDNVKMYYYEDEKFDFFDEVTGAIRNVFGPINAYAAEEAVQPRYDGGTVVIEGEGVTEEWLLINWLNYDAFIPAYEAWGEANIDDHRLYYPRVEDEDATALTYAEARRGYASDEAMLQAYIPYFFLEFIMDTPDFWTNYVTYAPDEVIINGRITEVGHYAFAFCQTIDRVTIGEDVLAIGQGAFAYTNIEEVLIPAAVTALEEDIFIGCERLDTVYIEGTIAKLNSWAFVGAAEDLNIICEKEATYRFLSRGEETVDTVAVIDANGEEATQTIRAAGYVHNSEARVILNPAVFA